MIGRHHNFADMERPEGSSHFVTGMYPLSTPLFGVLPHKTTTQEPQQIEKKDAKPRGRMSAYAYFVQTFREEHKIKHPNETVVFAEFSRKCAERWKTMSEIEKKRFQDMAERDKKRYEAEMDSYTQLQGKGRGRKRKRTKDPNAPKRALSAFFWFCHFERAKVKALNPELRVGEVAKELGKRWNEVSEDTKSHYGAMSAKDKARYEREIKAYKGKKAKGHTINSPPQPMVMPKPEGVEDDESGDDEGDEDDEDSGEDE